MLSNSIIQHKIKSLKDKKSELSGRKMNIIAELKLINIHNGIYRKAKAGLIKIDERTLSRRETLIYELNKIELEIIDVNKRIVESSRKIGASESDLWRSVVKEIFKGDQYKNICEEVDRRLNGETPVAFKYNFEKGIDAIMQVDQYKKMYLDELEKQQQIRIMLTKIIEDGCKRFGDDQFMKVISPLNRLVIPVKEINKKKLALSRVNHFTTPSSGQRD